LVKEIYHPSYVAKRMEIGAVMGAAPRRNVIRETSDPGDIIILSPASASFDLYPNFEVRGREFKKIVNALK